MRRRSDEKPFGSRCCRLLQLRKKCPVLRTDGPSTGYTRQMCVPFAIRALALELLQRKAQVLAARGFIDSLLFQIEGNELTAVFLLFLRLACYEDFDGNVGRCHCALVSAKPHSGVTAVTQFVQNRILAIVELVAQVNGVVTARSIPMKPFQSLFHCPDIEPPPKVLGGLS